MAGWFEMLAVVFVYGFLSSFVLSSASRNRRENRPNPAMVEYVGYAMIGVSMVLVGALALVLATGAEFPVD